MIENEVLARLPEHLRQYIKPQPYEYYTAIDQCVWKYTMRKSISFLTKHAHESYQEGLKATGISPDQIPSLYGMNRILKDRVGGSGGKWIYSSTCVYGISSL